MLIALLDVFTGRIHATTFKRQGQYNKFANRVVDNNSNNRTKARGKLSSSGDRFETAPANLLPQQAGSAALLQFAA
jgi:hypothetical protein